MRKVNLNWRCLLGINSYYNKGMLVDYGIQFPLGSGFGVPVIDFYVGKENHPFKIGWANVCDGGRFAGRDPWLGSDEDWIYSARVTFDKNEKKDPLLFQADAPHKIPLDKAQLNIAHLTSWGGYGRISEPKLFGDVAAYITQSHHYGHGNITKRLIYFPEVTRNTVNQAIKQITQKELSESIKIKDSDIDMIVDALFAEKVMSAHPESGFVDNKVFVT